MRSGKKIKKYLETWKWTHNSPNLLETAKVVLRGKCIALQAYLKEIEKSQINILTLQLKELVKQQATKTRVCRRKEIIKIRAELNDRLKKKNSKDKWIHKLVLWEHKQNWWIFNQIHQEKKRTQINKIRNERGEMTWIQQNYKEL